jgi:hypothetical protein
MLAVLTGDAKYGLPARDALKAIYDLRSKRGLLGRHIDIESGRYVLLLAECWHGFVRCD